MCYALPGPRCSPHARTKLEGLTSRRNEKAKQLREMVKELRDVRNELQASPSPRLQKRKDALNRRGSEVKAQVADLTEKVRLAQIDYDGTPQGQKELKEARESATTAKNSREMFRRMSKGRAKNASRRHMMESINRSKAAGGKSLNAIRGNCIHLSNHDTANPEIDQDLLSAA